MEASNLSWEIEVFRTDDGKSPFVSWVRCLEPDKRATVIAAIEKQLGVLGIDVCRSELGKALGGGLYEFRIRHDEGVVRRKADGKGARKTGQRILLRVFFHVYGAKVILLLGGYDKGRHPSGKRQGKEIERARKSLKVFKGAMNQQRRTHSDRGLR